MRVVVVGAGVAGLTLRRALRDVGIDVELVESRSGINESGAGLTLWPNATSRLDALGVLDTLQRSASELVEGQMLSADGTVLARVPIRRLSQKAGFPILGVRRFDLLRTLLGPEPSGVHFGRTVTDVARSPDSAQVTLDDGSQLSADLVVGADGINSLVRSLTIGGSKRYSGYVGLQGIAAFTSDATRAGRSEWTLGPGSQFGMIPAGPDHVYYFGTLNWPEASVRSIGDPLVMLRKRFGGWHSPIPELLEAVGEASTVITPIYDRPPTSTWTQGRITVLGDAAHGLTPTFGQGACLAVESACSLADHLSRSIPLSEALNDHEQSRIKRTRPIVRSSNVFGSALQVNSDRLSSARNWLVRLTPSALPLVFLRQIVAGGLVQGDTSVPPDL